MTGISVSQQLVRKHSVPAVENKNVGADMARGFLQILQQNTRVDDHDQNALKYTLFESVT